MKFLFLLFLATFCFNFKSVATEKISSYVVNIEILEDSSFLVKEKITYDFGSARKRGIFRDIPLNYKRQLSTKWGEVDTNFGIRVNVESVKNSYGKAYNYKLMNFSQGKRIRIGHPSVFVSGVKNYIITYRVKRAINRFKERDEFYWNVIGHNWSVPIYNVEASLTWPKGVLVREAKNYVGYLRSSKSVNNANFLSGSGYDLSLKSLSPGEGLTVGLSFPKGKLKEPSKLQKLIWFISDNVGYVLFFPIPLLIGLLFSYIHRKKGKDPYHPDTIQVRYSPPQDLNPAEVGTLEDETVDTSDIVATVLDLASRGYLKIKEMPSSSWLFLSDKNYKFIKRKPFINDNNLSEFEVSFLEALFSSKDSILLSDLKNSFYVHLGGLTSKLYKALIDKKIFNENPQTVRFKYLFGSAFLIGVLHLLMVFFLVFNQTPQPFVMLSVLFSVIMSIVIASYYSKKMPKKTRKGVKSYYEILGFKEFIIRVEKSKIKTLIDEDPEVFGRLLPYAIVLGCADEWAEKFEGLITEPLSWYEGADLGSNIHLFSSREFVNSMGQGINTMANTFASSPQAQGGAGGGGGFSSGGGGFSGGGFGGGGGGSW